MHRYARVASIAAAILVLAACGKATTPAATAKAADTAYPGQSAAQVLGLADHAMSSAKTVRMDGTASASDTDVSLQLAVARGKGATGTVTVGKGRLKIVTLGKDTYAQPNTALLSQLGPMGASIGTVLANKWVQADGTSLASLAGGTAASDAASILSSFGSSGSALGRTIPAGAALTRVPGKVVDGVQTTGVHFVSDRSTSNATQLTGTLYIATTGTPYPVLLERDGVHLVLSHWNQKVAIMAPPKSRIVNMDALGLTGLGGSGDLASQLAGAKG